MNHSKKQQLERKLESLQHEIVSIRQEIADCSEFSEKLELIFSRFSVRKSHDNNDDTYELFSRQNIAGMADELLQLRKINGTISDIHLDSGHMTITVREDSSI